MRKEKTFVNWDELRHRVIEEFALSKNSIHGPDHWRRVEANGLALAAQNGADETIVRLFAVLHDSKRQNDADDPQHGRRAAKFIEQLRGELFELEDEQFAHLKEAIAYHADGTVHEVLTIGTCWDADRFDLSRVGIKPSANFMSTTAAREIIRNGVHYPQNLKK